MSTYARKLFSVAAVFNFTVAAAALFARDSMTARLGLDPVTGTNVLFVDITALMIGVFGYSYACVAYDARKYRAYVSLGVIGKVLFVGATFWLWITGVVSARLPGLAAGDLVFAAVFIDYLRRTPDQDS